MQFYGYYESGQRGTIDFPLEYYLVDTTFPRYIMNYHWHMEFEFVRILSGEFHGNLDGQDVIAKEGDILFISGGTLHSGTPLNGCTYECIVFDMNVFLKHNTNCKKMVQPIVDHTILVYRHFKSDQPLVHDAVWNIFDAMRDKPAGYELIVFGQVYYFLGIVYANHLYYKDTEVPQTRSEFRRITQLKKVLELIENNYASALTLEDMAKEVHMSPKYFCRFFAEMTHQRPMDYLNRHRIEHACYALTSTDASVTEIAYGCGFNDLSYFIKTFKKYKGVTPGKYQS